MEMTGPILTLLLADGHEIIRRGIAESCKSHPDILVIRQCANGEEALAIILAESPDIAILDPHLRLLDGLSVMGGARGAQCPTKFIVLATDRDESVVQSLFAAGASGYALKDGPVSQLFEAIGVVRSGGQYLTPLLQPGASPERGGQEAPDAAAFATLSERECEVFQFLADGLRPRDIAKKLAISPKTVDTYRANIMRKLALDGIADLVRFALRRNLPFNSLLC